MHWHLHDATGYCWGDCAEFEDAALVAAQHTYPWSVPDAVPNHDILVVIEADFCIDVCREDGE
jgi:hypothetical protein